MNYAELGPPNENCEEGLYNTIDRGDADQSNLLYSNLEQ